MLGFSLGKIIVLLLIIMVVWYGFKVVARRGQSVGRDKTGEKLGKDRDDASRDTVHDMERCRVCGTFVPAAAARACGRDGCPYPG